MHSIINQENRFNFLKVNINPPYTKEDLLIAILNKMDYLTVRYRKLMKVMVRLHNGCFL